VCKDFLADIQRNEKRIAKDVISAGIFRDSLLQ
jgi:hypothetical protein